MSDRSLVISAQPSAEFRSAEARLLRSVENAKAALERAFVQLNELERALCRLGEMASALEALSNRLANLTISAASNVVSARSGAPLGEVRSVEQLAGIARDTALSARSLDSDVRRARVATLEASVAVGDSIRSLDALAPDVSALARGGGKDPANSEIRRVVIPVTSAPPPRREPARPDLVRDTWPMANRGRDLKN